MRHKTFMATASLALALSSIPMLSSSSYAETANIPVPKAAVATAFNAVLNSTKIHLDNFGPKNGTSWLKNQSYILLPTGSKKSFPIPDYTFEITPWRKLKYYVNDMNTNSMQVTVNGNRLNADAYFESQGEEIQARCIRRVLGDWGECTLDMERDIHLDNAVLSMSLVPIAYKGSISYSAPKVSFKTDVKIANKLCQAFKGVCGWLENKIKQEMTQTIGSEAKSRLDENGMKQMVADQVRNAPGIRNLIDPKWKVTQVTSQGSHFIVTVERPDQIDEASVIQLSLKPAQSQITSSCPAKVELDATIEMKHTVAGTGFLVYENGQKSSTFDWNAKKGSTVTSSVTRTFDGKPGTTSNGSAVMYIQWKGSDGKTYEKTSNKATFSVKCTQSVSDKIKL